MKFRNEQLRTSFYNKSTDIAIALETGSFLKLTVK